MSVLPKISVVIPSFNQCEFIEETFLSVISQNYPNIEIIVIDGGSTDKSIDIILKYKDNFKFWISEKDNGQSHAINKGFEKGISPRNYYKNVAEFEGIIPHQTKQ